MTDVETVSERLAAVERALVDGDPPAALAEAVELAARVDELEDRLERRERRLSAHEERLAAYEERLATVEAATLALRGYVGAVRHVNRTVERRADAALAAAAAVEAELAEPDERATPDGLDRRDLRVPRPRGSH